MTKQEQIKEITQIICRRSKDNICLIDKYLCDCNCGWARYAEVIYNADCRKAVEVRKETAKEILQKFHDWIGADFEENEDCDFIPILKKDFFRRVDEISKEYGLEVEE